LSRPCIATDNTAKVHIVTTSLKVTLRKLVMTQVFCGTRRAAIADWWWRRGRTAMFCRRANTWLIIAKTDHQNWLPIINSRVGNYRELSGKIGIPIIPDFSRERGSPNNGGILFYFWSCSAKCQIPDILRSVPEALRMRIS
jgi:hypothetical protein